MSLHAKNKNIAKRKKQTLKQHNKIKDYKYQILINGSIASFISLIIYAFIFAIPKGRYEPRFHFSQQENVIIYIIILAVPIITIIATSIWSIYRISLIKKAGR